MNDAVRRRGLVAVAGCVLVGTFAAFGPVMSADTVDRGPSHWVVAVVGAVIGGAAAWLAWPRLRRLPALGDRDRAVVVALAASIGGLTAATVASGLAHDAVTSEPAIIVEEPDASGPSQRAVGLPSDREGQRWNDLGGIEGAIALMIGLAMLVAAAVFFGRQSELRAVPASPALLRSHLALPDTEDDPEPDELVAALERTRAALLADDAPRTVVRRAYQQLLAELDAIGLARRNYEAPVEYVTRCLEDRDLPEAPLRSLTSVFELARFSDHDIDHSHVELAERSLREATTVLGANPRPGRRRAKV